MLSQRVRRKASGTNNFIRFLFALAFVGCGVSRAQVYDFKTYTMRQGLLSNVITALCQDSKGYLWIGTGEGISVYDGEAFRNYTIADGLASSLVNCITEDVRMKGVIWIGTNGGGLSRFSSGTFHTVKLGKTDWPNRINSITEDNSGVLYCATDDGVYKVSDGIAAPIIGEFAHGTYEQAVCDGDSLFVLDGNGKLAIFNLTDHDVTRLTGMISPHAAVSRLCLDSRGEMWAISPDGDLMSISRGRLYRHAAGPYPKFIVDDRAGELWIGTTGGVFAFESDNMARTGSKLISEANGLPQNDVTAGLIDREGDVWIGTSNKGLAKLAEKNSFEFQVKYEAFSANNSQAAVDAEGHVWVATADGLLEIWKDTSGSLMKYLHSYARMGVRASSASIQIASGNQVWLAGGNDCLYHFQIERSHGAISALRPVGSFSVDKTLAGKGGLCLYIDSRGRAWYSRDLVGVLEFNTMSGPAGGRVYTTKDGLPDNSIRAIHEDNKGNMWFGGYIGGLAELRKNSRNSGMTLYTTGDGLPDNSVRSIAEDDSGNLWIGTRYGGIAVKSGSKFHDVSVEDGLISNGVWAMTFDRGHGMFFATQQGLQELAGGNVNSRNWKSFGTSTAAYACGTASSNASGGHADLLWACNGYGVFVTDLSRPDVERVPPVIYMTGLLVNGKEFGGFPSAAETGPEIRLQYFENTLTFSFTGISLRDEGKLTFRYILNGVDDEWHVSSRRLPVTYATLRPGRYTFEVKAVNTAGIESEHMAILPFIIVPPYWQRWWFLMLSGILLISMIYFLIKVKVRRMLEIERVRARIATDLHDDIGSGLTRIAILANVALRQSEVTETPSHEAAEADAKAEGESFSTHSLVQRIGINARELVDSMSDVVWSIDPKNVTVGDLVTRFRTFAYEICEVKGIKLEIEIGKDHETLHLDPGIMRALLLITKEALNNSVKHSECKSVRVGVNAHGGEVRLVVWDDGRGFSTSEMTGGHGLENMRKRTEKLGGHFMLRSSPGTGTRIEISAPIGS